MASNQFSTRRQSMLNTRKLAAFIGSITIAVLVVATTFAAAPRTRPTTQPRQSRPVAPSLVPVKDDPKLPRVLIIGDSISMGYTPLVRERLKGKANVQRPTTNCGDTKKGLQELDQWLASANTGGASDRKWDVIHFNWGLHDLKYVNPKGDVVEVGEGKQNHSPAEYEKNLSELVKRLKATGATLIWCTTTPVPAKSKGRVGDDELKYNEAAAKVMKDNGIQVDDLWAFAKPQITAIQLPDNVHYSVEGYGKLADQVASTIEKALPEKKAAKSE